MTGHEETETSGSERAPGPIRAILLDAVGTLIHPWPSAAEVYLAAGRRHGSQLTLPQIRARFPAALKRHTQGQPLTSPLGLPGDHNAKAVTERRFHWKTSPRLERRRWRRIVAEVLDDVSDPGAVFDELWQHFGQAGHWRLYDDVPAAWRQLQGTGYVLGIASNFDHRLESVCRELSPLSQCAYVLHSAGLGYAKPDPRFYAAVAERLGLPRSQILLIGDDPERDYDAARTAGLAALWLCRDAASPNSDRPTRSGPLLIESHPNPAGSRQIVRSLLELSELLAF